MTIRNNIYNKPITVIRNTQMFQRHCLVNTLISSNAKSNHKSKIIHIKKRQCLVFNLKVIKGNVLLKTGTRRTALKSGYLDISSQRTMHPKCEVVDMELNDFNQVLEETEMVIKKCFEKYKIDEVFLSFNGGKDCTVLLDITLNILKQLHRREDIAKDLKVVYIRTNGPFKEIETFVKDIENHYGVNLVITDGELKATLERLLKEDSKLKACLMGTRRTDPYSAELQFMQKTDPNWPQIVRVSPLLNWSYPQIWSYIRRQEVPYCTLYDKGYTSIGSTFNTWPNPALAYTSNNGLISYRPAWELSDASLERAGRSNASKLNGNKPTCLSNIQ